MLQHEPFVDEVPRTIRYRSGHDVQLAHLELRGAVVLEPSVSRSTARTCPSGPDLRREPTGDRTTAGSDLQASGARLETDTIQMTDRDRIEGPLQPLEACTRLGCMLFIKYGDSGMATTSTSRPSAIPVDSTPRVMLWRPWCC